MLRAFVRSLFGGAASTAPTSAANAQKALVAAILELRAVVDSGSAEQIAVAIDVFKSKATAGDLDQRELADEVAKAEQMLTVLAYIDGLKRGDEAKAESRMRRHLQKSGERTLPRMSSFSLA